MFRILSPNEGDVYRMLPGVEPRYATVALRAAEGPGESSFQPDRHRFRAVSSAGDSAEVTVSVE